jgi:hypothetical protein
MDPNTQALLMGAAGAAEDKLYIEDTFSTYLYTGNGSTQTITNGIDLAGEGGLVWIKHRTVAYNHALFDTARGATNRLVSNGTGAEDTQSTSLTAFNSTGFTLGADLGGVGVNISSESHASWTFRKAAKFFDVVTYTGNGADNRTILHNLQSTPGFIIVKQLNSSGQWAAWHRSIADGYNLYLSLTNSIDVYNDFENAGINSTGFAVNATGSGGINGNGNTYVAYLFAHDAGGFGDSGNDNVVSCGSFTTDGSGSAIVNLGWEPQWVLLKRSDSSTGGDWLLLDTMRGWNLGNDQMLYANTSGAENPADRGQPTATGMSFDTSLQISATYVYIAIRRGPMKTPTSGTGVFNTVLQTPQAAGTVRTVGFPADLIVGNIRGGSDHYFSDRLRGFTNSGTTQNTPSLLSPSTAAEANSYPYFYDVWNTTAKDGDLSFLSNGVGWMFRRAPGFFDVVAYTGDSVFGRFVNHSLGVIPEMIIIKRRNSTENWAVYHSGLPFMDFSGSMIRPAVRLNESTAATTTINTWAVYETPASGLQSTYFQVNANLIANNTGDTYIAYLFATAPGVSKVGSYTGTGTTLDIDCGFTAGARFVLIKRTDSTGDWYVWDTARGIIAANDPYLLLNSTAAEVTNTDYIDPLNSGFQISSTAPAAINASGGSFIFLAVA